MPPWVVTCRFVGFVHERLRRSEDVEFVTSSDATVPLVIVGTRGTREQGQPLGIARRLFGPESLVELPIILPISRAIPRTGHLLVVVRIPEIDRGEFAKERPDSVHVIHVGVCLNVAEDGRDTVVAHVRYWIHWVFLLLEVPFDPTVGPCQYCEARFLGCIWPCSRCIRRPRSRVPSCAG